jgi:hypothetical protein
MGINTLTTQLTPKLCPLYLYIYLLVPSLKEFTRQYRLHIKNVLLFNVETFTLIYKNTYINQRQVGQLNSLAWFDFVSEEKDGPVADM